MKNGIIEPFLYHGYSTNTHTHQMIENYFNALSNSVFGVTSQRMIKINNEITKEQKREREWRAELEIEKEQTSWMVIMVTTKNELKNSEFFFFAFNWNFSNTRLYARSQRTLGNISIKSPIFTFLFIAFVLKDIPHSFISFDEVLLRKNYF